MTWKRRVCVDVGVYECLFYCLACSSTASCAMSDGYELVCDISLFKRKSTSKRKFQSTKEKFPNLFTPAALESALLVSKPRRCVWVLWRECVCVVCVRVCFWLEHHLTSTSENVYLAAYLRDRSCVYATLLAARGWQIAQSFA